MHLMFVKEYVVQMNRRELTIIKMNLVLRCQRQVMDIEPSILIMIHTNNNLAPMRCVVPWDVLKKRTGPRNTMEENILPTLGLVKDSRNQRGNPQSENFSLKIFSPIN
jgi:hypothetical protein